MFLFIHWGVNLFALVCQFNRLLKYIYFQKDKCLLRCCVVYYCTNGPTNDANCLHDDKGETLKYSIIITLYSCNLQQSASLLGFLIVKIFRNPYWYHNVKSRLASYPGRYNPLQCLITYPTLPPLHEVQLHCFLFQISWKITLTSSLAPIICIRSIWPLEDDYENLVLRQHIPVPIHSNL